MSNTAFRIALRVYGLLAALLILLRVTKLITWSWWWITLPVWGIAVVALILFGVLAYAIYKDETLKDYEYE